MRCDKRPQDHCIYAVLLYTVTIFLPVSPATIICIDKKTGKLVDYYFHNTDARVCIHGLTVV